MFYKDYRSFHRAHFSVNKNHPKTKNLSDLLYPEERSYKVHDFNVNRECSIEMPIPSKQIRVSAMPKDY